MNITKVKKTKRGRKLTVWRYLALGYLVIILLGSVLLILPFATKDGEKTSYLNALFTAVSSTCVTGLVPYDTGLHWSTFGQVVILLLIQTGGIGFTTFVSVVFLMAGKLGVYERRIMMESYGGDNNYHGLGRLIKRIVLGSFLVEFIGASLLCIRFVPQFGGIGVYYAIFHAVSAFCNAGFDLMGGAFGEAYVSLTRFATDPLVSLVIAFLILLGGLGFCVWGDVIDCKFNFKKFRLFTQVVLIVTGALVVGGTGLFLLFERHNPAYADYNFGQKLLCSFFNSVTARTAGFNTTPLEQLSDSGYLLMVVLMFIGGSSGSTAGGIKMSTFAVIIMGMFAAFRGRKDVNLGRKRLEPTLVAQALAIFAAYLTLVIMATITICAIEPNGFKEILFETVSAIGTVGLSISVTPTLHAASKVILILLMYTGRVGILTLAHALGKKRSSASVRKPAESLFIG